MTPEEQRIAIAKACGWLAIQDLGYQISITGREFIGLHGFKEGWKYGDLPIPIPDYLNDLNAMHEAIDPSLFDKADLWNKYLYLAVFKDSEVTPDMLTDAELTYIINNATASQRAEAFLKTKGLWKD